MCRWTRSGAAAVLRWPDRISPDVEAAAEGREYVRAGAGRDYDSRIGGRARRSLPRAAPAGIATKSSSHSFRATASTTNLQNAGKQEAAQQMAGHETPRTTGPYDRRTEADELDQGARGP